MCPYCAAPVYAERGMIRCTQCRFEIERERRDLIAENRSQDGRPIVKIKWQFLHDRKCPICENQLYPNPRNENAYKCLSEGCSFKITEERIQIILADDTHPANRYR